MNLVYGFCFGVAVIAANNVWRGRRATFDEAWEEGRHKAGGILIAAIGFYFLIYVGQYAGRCLGSAVLQIVLQLVAAFFLIYTIPAAAIGGMPGNLAIGALVPSGTSEFRRGGDSGDRICRTLVLAAGIHC